MKKTITITLSLFSLLIMSNQAEAQDRIRVDASLPIDSSTAFMQGFLHGGPLYLDSTMVAQLKPQFWRIGAYTGAGGSYEDVIRFQPKVTFVLNDLYMIVNNIPSQTQSHPWINNWSGWDSLVAMAVTSSINNNAPIDYWDVWGEPDNFWTGTYGQWIEMYRRTDSIVHAIQPSAKLTGPEFGFGTCNFSTTAILDFLDSLHQVNGHVDGVSWHEFCNPEDIPLHVQQLRDSLGVRPWLGNLRIHISEYAGPANHTIPGWNVGWLYYFEQTKVDWVSHACWNETDGINSWSDCQYGLNGLFMSDNVTPQPNYWVHRAYAELDSERIQTFPAQLRTVALASKNSNSQELKIMVAHYDNPNLGSHNAPINVEVKVTHYPYCSNCTLPLYIQRIPSNTVAHAVALPAPVLAFAGTVTFISDSATIVLNGFVDGDVHLIYINPSGNSLLSLQENTSETKSEITISPNPFSNQTTIYSATPMHDATLRIYNVYGELVEQQMHILGETYTITNNRLSEGLYFVQVEEAGKVIAVEKLILVNRFRDR